MTNCLVMLLCKLSLPGFAASCGSRSAAARPSHQRHLDKRVSVRSSVSPPKHRAQRVWDAAAPDFYRADLLTAAEGGGAAARPGQQRRAAARARCRRRRARALRPAPPAAAARRARGCSPATPYLPSIIAKFYYGWFTSDMRSGAFRAARCHAVPPRPPFAPLMFSKPASSCDGSTSHRRS